MVCLYLEVGCIFMTRRKQLPLNGSPRPLLRVRFSGSPHLVSDSASQLGCSYLVSTLVGELPLDPTPNSYHFLPVICSHLAGLSSPD